MTENRFTFEMKNFFFQIYIRNENFISSDKDAHAVYLFIKTSSQIYDYL